MPSIEENQIVPEQHVRTRGQLVQSCQGEREIRSNVAIRQSPVGIGSNPSQLMDASVVDANFEINREATKGAQHRMDLGGYTAGSIRVCGSLNALTM